MLLGSHENWYGRMNRLVHGTELGIVRKGWALKTVLIPEGKNRVCCLVYVIPKCILQSTLFRTIHAPCRSECWSVTFCVDTSTAEKFDHVPTLKKVQADPGAVHSTISMTLSMRT